MVSYANGHLPDNVLRDIPGGRLETHAAASWLRLRAVIGRKAGVWIAPTSSRCAYRTYAEQEYFWNVYQSGGNLAARPGTSNHGLGLAVDCATTDMTAAINEYGADYGWQKKWSDAPQEWWHLKYSKTHDKHINEPFPVKNTGRVYLTSSEKHYRDVLVRERQSAKRHGGWNKVAPQHLSRAKDAKDWLNERLTVLKASGRERGWHELHRSERYKYIKETIDGK